MTEKQRKYMRELQRERSTIVGRLVQARGMTDDLASYRLANLTRELDQVNTRLQELRR